MSPEHIFRQVYRNKLWGNDRSIEFDSGEGSHDPQVVVPYVKAVKQFIHSLNAKPDMVDLGCGDFNVGRQIREYCNNYIAVDIVDELIEKNRAIYEARNVSFRVLDIIDDELPDGDIACIRQVLQHLRNDQIQRIVSKLYKFKHLIVTEHLPSSRTFIHNIDKHAGPGIRLALNSGVVIGSPPFNFISSAKKIICSVPKFDGIIETTVYSQ
jgi:SAM-dependent methyltransferase